MSILISAALFITIMLLIEGSYFTYALLHDPQRQRIKRHLYDAFPLGEKQAAIDITRKTIFSGAPWVSGILAACPLTRFLSRRLQRANSLQGLGVSLILSLVLFFIGLVMLQKPFNIGAGVGLALLPIVYLVLQKRRRRQEFERQLPEALDLIARALRAGHTFNVGMKIVGDEFPDPLGTEFARTVDEINFGGGLQKALENLSYRASCTELRFFVTAVMVQRETGGNLAEIIGKASDLIRQRFELLGRVQVLAGEGKLSAYILIILPFLIGFLTYVINRDYLMLLYTDPTGKWLIVVAGFFMMMGILVILRMIRIKV